MKRNTKEEILIEALKLFACRGYEGVTVRDIAEKLHIRQSSLYKHYKSKQDIFDSIVKRMNEENRVEMEKLSVPHGDIVESARAFGSAAVETIEHYGEALFLYWTCDEYASCFRRMLILEQFCSPEMAQLYQEFLGQGVIDYMTQLFAEMTRQGYFYPADPEQMAFELYSPIFMLMSIFDAAGDREAAVQRLRQQIRAFAEHYTVSGGLHSQGGN